MNRFIRKLCNFDDKLTANENNANFNDGVASRINFTGTKIDREILLGSIEKQIGTCQKV
jgi:hypothetical protein